MIDGKDNQEGRLEVYHDHKWGTICNKGFDDTDASAACQSFALGFVPKKLLYFTIKT